MKNWSGKEFDGFVKHLNERGGRKGVLDKALAEALRGSVFNKERFIAKAYKKVNAKSLDSYHALRRRLSDQILTYLSQASISENEVEDQVMEWLRASRYLFKQGYDSWGIEVLRKASSLAKEHGEPFLEAWVLNERITQINSDLQIDLAEFNEARKVLNSEIELEQRMLLAQAELAQALKKRRIEAVPIQSLEILEQVFENYHLSVESIQNPLLLHRLTVMVRAVLVADKDFTELYSFLKDQMQHIEQLGGYTKGAEEAVEMQYMLAHSSYRCREYEDVFDRMPRLYEAIHSLVKVKRELWFRKTVLLEAQTKNFSGQLNSAMELLSRMKNHSAFSKSSDERHHLVLNLGVLYFQKGMFDQVFSTFKLLRHRDNWYKDQMGIEWVFKKQMIELIALIELHEDGKASARIHQLKAYSKTFFDQTPYQRILSFLDLIHMYLLDREGWKEEAVMPLLSQKLLVNRSHQEDLQAVAFYTWLKSKALKREYYSLLLEMVAVE
ncbi:MAG: hypothetical protein ACPGWM_03270 [Flavobacteriales bacterium]